MSIFYSIANNGRICFYGTGCGRYEYLGYTLRDAIQRFRADAGLCRKRLKFVEIPA